MDTTVSALFALILHNLASFLLIEMRLASTLGIVFFLRAEWVSRKIMMSLSLILTLFILMTVDPSMMRSEESLSAQVLMMLNQGILGILTGLIINFFMEFFVGFGQIVSMQAGLGFVNFFVPKVGNISPMTQFFMLLSTAVFFSINGHLLVIRLLVQSIEVMPKLPTSLDAEMFKSVLNFSGILFSGSVMLSIAVMFSVMLSNITLAILTKFSPQMNLFSMGINISLIICFFIIYVSFDVIVENGTILFNQLMFFVEQLQL